MAVAIELTDDDGVGGGDDDDDDDDDKNDDDDDDEEEEDFKCPVDSDGLSLAFIYAWIKFLVLLVAMASFDPSTAVFIFNVLLVSTWLLEEPLFWIDKDVVEVEGVVVGEVDWCDCSDEKEPWVDVIGSIQLNDFKSSGIDDDNTVADPDDDDEWFW